MDRPKLEMYGSKETSLTVHTVQVFPGIVRKIKVHQNQFQPMMSQVNLPSLQLNIGIRCVAGLIFLFAYQQKINRINAY